METKFCTTCKTEYFLTVEYFQKDCSHKDGFTSRCKSCITMSRKKRYLANRETELKNHKTYRESHKEQARELSRNWKRNNPERAKANNKRSAIKCKDRKLAYDTEYRGYHRQELNKKSRQYYYQNKEQHTISVLRWKKENRDSCNISTRKYRSTALGLESTLTKEEWKLIVDFFDSGCAYCGRPKSLAREHFVPVSNGGSFTKENIIPACRSCNSSKNNKGFSEWYPFYKYYSAEREQKITRYIELAQVASQV